MFKALEKKIIQISGQQYQPTVLSFEGLLVAASYLYGAGTVFRNQLYRSGCLEQKSLPCPVISVGNITAGGTGKTPMATYLADLLTRLGRKPVVISRGYKGGLKKGAAVVGNGCDLFLDADQAGDEPHMMARMRQFPVVVGKNRYQAGLLAMQRLSPDIMVLDDGFQHIRLKRDIDLLLMDHDQPFGNGRMLPAGRLREPAARALARAHAVILTRCPDIIPQKPHPVSCLAPHLPVFYTRHQPFLAGFYRARNPHRIQGRGMDRKNALHKQGDRNEKINCNCEDKNIPGLDLIKGCSVFLFSGIALNHAFYQTIQALGGKILRHLEFEDHYRYKKGDILQIVDQAKAAGAQMVVTTHKDWVKLDPQLQWPIDLAVVGIQITLEDEQGFERFIATWLNE